MESVKTFKHAFTAGIAISIGSAIYLSCENKVLGGFLFSIALFTICVFGLNLFTGKIGYMVRNRTYVSCGIIWLGNLLGCIVSAILLRIAKPSLVEAASQLIAKKLALSPIAAVIMGVFCGILMYIAVDNFRNSKSDFGKYLGIMICVPTFIFCGFEHSIANMSYCAIGVMSVQDALSSLLFIILVTIGNAIGAVVFDAILPKRD